MQVAEQEPVVPLVQVPAVSPCLPLPLEQLSEVLALQPRVQVEEEGTVLQVPSFRQV